MPDALDDDVSGALFRGDGTVRRVSQLVIDEDKLEGASLVARLEEEGVTGIRFKPIDEYTRFDRL